MQLALPLQLATPLQLAIALQLLGTLSGAAEAEPCVAQPDIVRKAAPAAAAKITPTFLEAILIFSFPQLIINEDPKTKQATQIGRLAPRKITSIRRENARISDWFAMLD